ncbi:hypothetical protein [Bradyrhizobium erythrophlei]|jgi:hypothetical protein|uniref:hypothetical protein n=1 Tax=Bradyrhizobium erythrophlei TaxID=1437360 RepID=UPI001FCD33A8|nr:hypothetical protein [Bradyrhizobium erythrophlei]
MHSTEAGDGSEIEQADLARQVGIDIFDNPLEAPFLQRPDRLPAQVGIAATICGAHRRTQPGEPGLDRPPQSFGAMLVMFKHNSFKGTGQRSDDVVAAAVGDISRNDKTVVRGADFFGCGFVWLQRARPE